MLATLILANLDLALVSTFSVELLIVKGPRGEDADVSAGNLRKLMVICASPVNTLKSGMSQLVKNELPLYEIISGAAIAFAALLLILPGFATDIIGVLLVFPLTRKIILSKYSKKNSPKNKSKEKNFIEGEYEDIDDKDGK